MVWRGEHDSTEVCTVRIPYAFVFLFCFFSLLVSPNPSQPWLAVSTSSPKQLQIYDYATCKLKNIFDLGIICYFGPEFSVFNHAYDYYSRERENSCFIYSVWRVSFLTVSN